MKPEVIGVVSLLAFSVMGFVLGYVSGFPVDRPIVNGVWFTIAFDMCLLYPDQMRSLIKAVIVPLK